MRAPRHVLIVDDEPLIRDVLSTVLDLEDLEVSTAADGRSALEALETERPDVVVCDVTMPGIDGLEVCRRIKADPATAHLPVVLLTARDREEDRRAGREAGCDAYLTKPFSALRLIEIIGGLGVGAGPSGPGPTEGVG